MENIKELFEKAKREYPEDERFWPQKYDRYIITENPEDGEYWMYGCIDGYGEPDLETPLFQI